MDTPTTPSHDWLTIDEVAAYLRVHRDTVQRAITAGRLHAGRPSGNRRGPARIHRDDVRAWLQAEPTR